MKTMLSYERIKRACKLYDGKTIMYGYKRGALKAQRKPKFRPSCNYLAEKGFDDKLGNLKPPFAYFQCPQSYSIVHTVFIPHAMTLPTIIIW